MKAYTMNNEKKAIKELDMDELEIISGGEPEAYFYGMKSSVRTFFGVSVDRKQQK